MMSRGYGYLPTVWIRQSLAFARQSLLAMLRGLSMTDWYCLGWSKAQEDGCMAYRCFYIVEETQSLLFPQLFSLYTRAHLSQHLPALVHLPPSLIWLSPPLGLFHLYLSRKSQMKVTFLTQDHNSTHIHDVQACMQGILEYMSAEGWLLSPGADTAYCTFFTGYLAVLPFQADL